MRKKYFDYNIERNLYARCRKNRIIFKAPESLRSIRRRYTLILPISRELGNSLFDDSRIVIAYLHSRYLRTVVRKGENVELKTPSFSLLLSISPPAKSLRWKTFDFEDISQIYTFRDSGRGGLYAYPFFFSFFIRALASRLHVTLLISLSVNSSADFHSVFTETMRCRRIRPAHARVGVIRRREALTTLRDSCRQTITTF